MTAKSSEIIGARLEGVQQFNYSWQLTDDNPFISMFLKILTGQEKDRLLEIYLWINQVHSKVLSLMLRTGLDTYNELRDRKRALALKRFPKGNYREDENFFNEQNLRFPFDLFWKH